MRVDAKYIVYSEPFRQLEEKSAVCLINWINSINTSRRVLFSLSRQLYSICLQNLVVFVSLICMFKSWLSPLCSIFHITSCCRIVMVVLTIFSTLLYLICFHCPVCLRCSQYNTENQNNNKIFYKYTNKHLIYLFHLIIYPVK